MGKKRGHREADEQKRLAEWLDLRFPGYWFHPPNGGRRARFEAENLRREGVKAGVPDVIVLAPFVVPGDRSYTGAAIELKAPYTETRKRRDAKRTQKRWIVRLKWAGFYTRVCWGAGESIALLESLYKDTPLPDASGRTLRVCWSCCAELHPRIPTPEKKNQAHRCMRGGVDTCRGSVCVFASAQDLEEACKPTEGDLAALERKIANRKPRGPKTAAGDVTPRARIDEVLEWMNE